jgi:outer membrane receptor protein involved in Fe transport
MLNNDLILRASYKNIFRNPSFSDLYYTRVGNRQLKPEYATQYSLGTVLTKAISEKIRMVSLSLDGYFNQVKDKIIASPTKDLGTWSMQNLGKVNIAGLDASLKTNIDLTTINLQISSNYTYQYAVDVTDRTQKSVYLNQIPYTPQHTLSSNAAILIKKWGLNYNYIFSSERFYTSQNLPIYKVPGFAVSDASIVYKSEIQKLPTILSAEVNNLFNTSYSFIRSFPMPGRSIRISINIVI